MLDLFLPDVDADIDDLHQSTALYTQIDVVDQVLSQAGWPEQGGRMLDPGAGDGAFTERAIERLQPALNDVEGLSQRIEAWEIHPIAAADARGRIRNRLEQMGWRPEAARQGAESVVREADFLAPGPKNARFQYVLGNPPYLRYANLPERFKRLYAGCVPEHARGDLLHAFLDRSSEVLHDGGCLSLVTSDRWLFNEGAAELRERIGERFGVRTIRRLPAESAFNQAKTRRKGTPPRVHPVVVNLVPRCSATRPLTREPVYPDGAHRLEIPANTVPLGEIASVRIAPWIGTAGVFVLPMSEAHRFPAGSWVPAVDTDDVDGDVLREPTRIALMTQRNQAPPAAVFDHLERSHRRLAPRARRDPFWLPPESWGPLPYEHDSFLIPRIATRFKAIRLPAGVLPINHNLTVVSSSLGTERLRDILSAELTHDWIDSRAPRIDNGYLSITTKFLRRLPATID